MLAAVFTFRGRLNRLQYFLANCGLGLALVVLAMILVAGVLGGRSLGGPDAMATLRPTALYCIVVLGLPYLWISFSLQSRRLRDIGWEPIFVIPAWIGLEMLDRLAVWAAPQIAAAPQGKVSWLSLLLNAGLGLCLLFWPGRPSFDVAAVFDDVPPPPSDQPRGQPQSQPAMVRASAAPVLRPTGSVPAGFGRRGL
jgi:uncharacterized membrane protein YhaH (DUF805 family)